MSSYTVVAPYVTLKVHDLNGSEVVQGYYKGAVVEDPVKGDSLDKHVRTGMVEMVSDASDDDPARPPKVADVLAEVGEDKAKATAALEQESARGDAARTTLVEKLQAVIDAS